MEETMEEFYISSDGIKLHAKLQKPEGLGKYPMVIIVHGLTGNMEEEHIVAAAETFCEMGCAALRVEMYGHGKSEGPFEDHTLFKWANNILDVVKYAKTLDDVTDLYLCGHSQGGLLTIMAGGLMPDIFKAIIPMSPAVNIPVAVREGNFFGQIIDFNDLKDSFDFFGNTLNADYMRVARMIDADDYIDRYHKPVLIIHGDQDEAVPISYGKACADRYEQGRLEIIKDADHCYVGQVDELRTILRSYMKELLEQ